MFAARARELAAEVDAHREPVRERGLAGRFDEAARGPIDRTLAKGQANAARVAEETMGARRQLGGITVFSLILSVAIVWLYVLRGVARRLRRLSGQMRGLASGANDIQFADGARRDEIGQMARALEVFRWRTGA